jgi:prepilin-type N-terminal cleavage/methylation domain-containing protein
MLISSRRSRLVSRGFTLVELLLVVTIMLILTSVFLIRQRNFDSSTVLSSLAYSIALSLRQAQLFGTASRETSVNAFQGANPARAYGIHIYKTYSTYYVLFADKNNDGQYQCTSTSDPNCELVQTFKIPLGYTISKFCADSTCWSAASPNLDYLTIIFRRPNPDACFATNVSPNACQASGTQVYTTGYIQITGGESNTRSVTITLTGQINVNGQGT